MIKIDYKDLPSKAKDLFLKYGNIDMTIEFWKMEDKIEAWYNGDYLATFNGKEWLK